VRKHYLDTLREACRRYDLDGIELDWLRSPVLFRHREVDTAVMTAFVTEARAILDASAKRAVARCVWFHACRIRLETHSPWGSMSRRG